MIAMYIDAYFVHICEWLNMKIQSTEPHLIHQYSSHRWALQSDCLNKKGKAMVFNWQS